MPLSLLLQAATAAASVSAPAPAWLTVGERQTLLLALVGAAGSAGKHLPIILLDTTWPTLHQAFLSLISAGLTFLATWFWTIRNENRTEKKAESQAIADLKQKQQSDILKIEGAIAIVVNSIDRLAGTAEQVTTITERVAGNSARINETRREMATLRDTVQPQLAELKAAVQHLRDA